MVHFDRSELLNLIFKMNEPNRSNLFQDIISSYKEYNSFFLDSNKTPYSISKHSYFSFTKDNIASLISYFQYFKTYFFDTNSYSNPILDKFYEFIKNNTPNEYWEQLNLGIRI
jgi:hypothetical protein